MTAGDFAFGSFVLNDNTNYVVEEGHPPAAPVALMRLPLSRRAGSILTLSRHTEHVALVRGIVKSTTFQDTEDKLDALMLALYDGEQNLKLGYQDERYWKASLEGRPAVTKMSGLLYAYQATFLVPDPYAYAASASSDAPGATLFTLA